MATKPNGVQTADFQDLFRRQFGSTMTFSKSVIATTCGFTLLVVSLLCSQMKMGWVAAPSDVAIVENILSEWNWTMIEFPRYRMSVLRYFSIPKGTIPVFIKSTFPEPASIIDKNFLLKSFPQSFARRFDELLEKSVASITASAREVARGVVAAFGVEVKVAQANTQHIVAGVADTQPLRGAFEIEPEPTRSVNRIAVLSEHSASSVIGASSPNFTWSQCGVVCGNGTVRINVLVEPEDWVHELGRHNGSFVVFSGSQSGNDRLSAATLANIGS